MDASVAVVGSGLAGRMAALAAARTADVVVLTDGPLDKCNSMMAQGGLHVPDPDEASIAGMVADIVRSARVPVDTSRARALAAGAVEVFDLLRQWGLDVDLDGNGQPRRLQAGGMSEPRVVTIGDSVGPPLLRLLGERLDDPRIRVRTHTFVRDVEPHDDHVDLRIEDGSLIGARRLVLATGGTAFAHANSTGAATTNPRNRNGGMLSLMRSRGAEVVDDDVWQYQPFGLVDGPAGPPRRCVPETLASLGCRLLDRDGRELLPLPNDRLTVTEAMRATWESRSLIGGRGRGFLLTLSDIPVDTVVSRFPHAARVLKAMDALGEDVLVAPFLHYQLGGLKVDEDGRTSLSGIFAAGEITGGLHGRNRLMGAGVTDALVSGWRAGATASREARELVNGSPTGG